MIDSINILHEVIVTSTQSRETVLKVDLFKSQFRSQVQENLGKRLISLDKKEASE